MQTLLICDKIPPFPASCRKRAKNCAPYPLCQESRSMGCKGGHGSGVLPASWPCRPIPDGSPPLSGANKGENALCRVLSRVVPRRLPSSQHMA